ncbi:MAG: hypothetical protein ACFE9R_19435 [Candidatus Hermodarchaeota archaeon]
MNDYYVQYIDGNGNQFIIKREIKATIEYIPVKPKNSSSGIYNGGNYIKKNLKKSQFLELSALLQQVIQNKDNKIENRTKGSGKIIHFENNQKNVYLIAPKSSNLIKLEAKLHDVCE